MKNLIIIKREAREVIRAISNFMNSLIFIIFSEDFKKEKLVEISVNTQTKTPRV